MRVLLVVAGLLSVVGCSGKPSRITPPSVDADGSALKAMKRYDGDHNQQLAVEELAACPSLREALGRYDSNANGSLTTDEVAAGIRGWSEGRMGATSLPFRLQLDGRALEGAEVKLIPESFLGDAIKPAAGKSETGGRGVLGMKPEDAPAGAPDMPIVQPGLYRVEITHPSVSIPAKYNLATTLGLEVASYMLSPAGVVWELTSGR